MQEDQWAGMTNSVDPAGKTVIHTAQAHSRLCEGGANAAAAAAPDIYHAGVDVTASMYMLFVPPE